MSLIKDYRFINLCFGVSIVTTADYAFSSLLPLLMSDIGYTSDQTSLTLTINGMAELISKILLTIMSLMVNVKSKYLFFVAIICMGFARAGEYILRRNSRIKCYKFLILKMTMRTTYDLSQVFYCARIRLWVYLL